jgi:YjbE family integral membrane protein
MLLDWIASILQIVLVNGLLSGDNALVIALAAHNLPAGQRRRAMLWGTGLAIVMRLILTCVVSSLLLIPGLRFLGAVLLAYIACKLIQEEAQSAGSRQEAPANLIMAIARIALADLVMSFDNVIAIAAVSQSDPLRLIVGLVLSITMVLALSSAIVAIMNRLRWIVYAGTAILALAAASMMQHDIEAFQLGTFVLGSHASASPLSGWPLRVTLLSICLTSNFWWPRGRRTGTPSA